MKQPKPGSCMLAEELEAMSELWGEDEEALLEELKAAIVAGLVLARPDPQHQFYLMMDWSCEGMGAVLLQAEDTLEARTQEQQEIEGEKCTFNQTISGLHLRPIAFISQRMKEGMEKSMHLYVGEAATL